MNLSQRATSSLAILAIVMAAVLFACAGSLRYWQGWIYLVVFFGASVLTTRDLLVHDPALLERRLSAGPFAERRASQMIIMTAACVGFLGLLVVPALDWRLDFPLGWTRASLLIEWIGAGLTLLGFYGVFRVYRVNSYASATIQIVDDQRVVTSGLYAYVRHPMYSTASLMLIGTPLLLGSWLGLIPFVVVLAVLVWRLFDEERLLEMELPGYRDYQARVRWRLVPYVF